MAVWQGVSDSTDAMMYPYPVPAGTATTTPTTDWLHVNEFKNEEELRLKCKRCHNDLPDNLKGQKCSNCIRLEINRKALRAKLR